MFLIVEVGISCSLIPRGTTFITTERRELLEEWWSHARLGGLATLGGRGVWWACASRAPAQRWCPETLSLCPCCPNLRYPSPVWHWWPWFSQPKFTAHCFTRRVPHRTFLSVHTRDKEGKPSSWLPVPRSISVSYRSQLHTPIGFHQSLQPSALMCIACSFIFGTCCCFYH